MNLQTHLITAALAASLLAASVGPAMACRLALAPTPTAESEAADRVRLVRMAQNSEMIVEIEFLDLQIFDGKPNDHDIDARIMGGDRAGEIISFYYHSLGECRPATSPGERGITMITPRPFPTGAPTHYSFSGFLTPLELKILREEGLIPREQRKRRARRGQ
jgi:hypothetical protein